MPLGGGPLQWSNSDNVDSPRWIGGEELMVGPGAEDGREGGPGGWD